MNHWAAWELQERLWAQGLHLELNTEPLLPEAPPVGPEERRRFEERIAASLRVPYWIIGEQPRPRWRDRPIWRLRAIVWRRWPR